MLRFCFSYIFWHYTKAYKEIFILSRNFFWFVSHLFSIKELLKTFFSPWQRLGERYGGGFDIAKWFEVKAVNTLMRLVGMFIRLTMIILGVLSLVVTSILSVCILIVWTLLPALILFLFVSAIKLFLVNQNG